MIQPFEIIFDFPLAHSDLTITLKATAELHHSSPFYAVYSFHTASSNPDKTDPSMLPPQEIKQIERNSSNVWVHKDSGRESMLSLAIGKGIEDALKKR